MLARIYVVIFITFPLSLAALQKEASELKYVLSKEYHQPIFEILSFLCQAKISPTGLWDSIA